MSKISDPSPELNRLRAAAGLAPLIESGLLQGTIDAERAATMARFCEWARDHGIKGDPEADRLSRVISEKLVRLEALLG